MTNQDTPFYLYKGDDTAFDGANVIQFVISSDTTDLSRFSGFFQLGDFKQVANITDGTMRVEIGRSYTSKFLLGPMNGIFKLVDKLGRVKTVTNTIKFYITDDVSLVGQNQSISIEGVDYQILVNLNVPLTQYNDLQGKPSINGVELVGNKTANDLHLATDYSLQNHINDTDNPHLVTKEQVGLGNVDNTSDENKPLSLASREAIGEVSDNLTQHIQDINNPHNVTKSQVGLGNVDNTADMDKPVSTATLVALAQKQGLLTQEQLLAVNSGADATKIANIAKNAQAIATINSKIPTQASTSNQLADKGFVNSTVQTSTAHFRGNWETYAAIPTDGSLYPADEFGVHEPGPNDYLVVRADETQDGGTWRYKYTGNWATNGKNGWEVEYEVNETPLTAAQLAALNSGITSNLVTQISTNANNITSLQNGKQDVIGDLSSIRSGASAGATALQPDIAASTYATKSALTSGLEQKQDTITDLSTIRSGAAAGATALQPATAASTYVPLSQKGVASGVASLDSNGKVPGAQIPFATAAKVGGIKSSFDSTTATWTVITEEA